MVVVVAAGVVVVVAAVEIGDDDGGNGGLEVLFSLILCPCFFEFTTSNFIIFTLDALEDAVV